MRAAPAVRLTLCRFGATRVALGLLGAAATACLAAWVLSWRDSPAPWHAAAACAAAALAAFALAYRLPAATVLHWDGRCWHLGPPGPTGDACVSGEIEVALDLGAWLLLRLRPQGTRRWSVRGHWLPVQRRGLEGQWHALRCALYAPRPDAAPGR